MSLQHLQPKTSPLAFRALTAERKQLICMKDRLYPLSSLLCKTQNVLVKKPILLKVQVSNKKA